jgi:hypothetical protein
MRVLPSHTIAVQAARVAPVDGTTMRSGSPGTSAGSSEITCCTIGAPSIARTAIRLTRACANSSTCSASGYSISLRMYAVTLASGQISSSTAKPSLRISALPSTNSGLRTRAIRR